MYESSTTSARRTIPLSLRPLWLLLVAAACADEPTAARRAAPTATLALGSETTLLSEKARVAAAQEASKATYDSLKALWDERDDDEDLPDGGRFGLCDPIQYTATVKRIGPEGGTLDFGPHTLRIPPGAVTSPTVITAESMTSLRVEARFSPHGLVFAVPATLTLSYQHCRAPRPGRAPQIVYLAPTGSGISEWLISSDDDELDEVRAGLRHFSAYAVAY